MRFFAIAAVCLVLLAYNYRESGTAASSANDDHLYYYPQTSMIADTLSPSLQLAAFPSRDEGQDTGFGAAAVTYGEEQTARTVRPGDAAGRDGPPKLAALVQEELKRLGCYRGAVDNIWGRKSRDALKQFGKAASVRVDAPTAEGLETLRAASTGCGATVCTGPKCQAPARVVSVEPPKSGRTASDAAQSYLPPWVKAAPKGDLETGAAPQADTPRKRRAKVKRAPATARTAPPPRRPVVAGHKSFGFSWSGQY